MADKPTKKTCYFCDNEVAPTYKNPDALRNYVSARAKIASRKRSGACAKHQRKLAISIKRARHLGLLPFKMKI